MAKRKRKAPKVVESAAPALPPHPPPVPFSAILGQKRAIETLNTAIRSGRLHHAWIFHGPLGVGKFTTALAFAAVVLDPTSKPSSDGLIQPDPDSRTQRLLASASCPELHIVTKELTPFSREDQVRRQKQRTIPIDVAREFLIEPAALTAMAPPGAVAGKVFIVDEAELLGTEAQNALLKTLEEPAPGTIIVLVTSREDRLKPTIRSRCQRIAFAPLDEQSMSRWFETSAMDITGERGAWVRQFAAGSPGVAMRAVEGGIDRWHEALAPMLAEIDRGRFPPDFAKTMSAMIDDWAKRWVADHANASKEAANHAAAAQMFRLLAAHYRDAIRATVDDNLDERRMRRRLTAIDAILEAERQLAGNVNLGFVMESLTARMIDAGA